MAYLTNAIIWKYGDQGTFEIPIGFSEAMACVLSSRLLLNVRGLLRNAEAEASQARRPGPSAPFGGRHGPQVHIRTVIETVTDHDGDGDDNLDDKTPRLATPESAIPVVSRHIEGRGSSALERGAGGHPGVRHQVSAGEAFELRSMKAL